MQIWELAASCEKDIMLTVDPAIVGGDFFQKNFNRKVMGKDWMVPPIEIIYKNRKVRDFVSFLSVPVISEKAKIALEPLIASSCEIMPLIKLRDQQYYAVNVLNVIDCLDVQKSDVAWLSNEPKKIRRVHKGVFDENRIPPETIIFKIPDGIVGSVYVTRPFADAVIAHGLRGASFRDPAQENIILSALGKPTNTVPGLPQ